MESTQLSWLASKRSAQLGGHLPRGPVEGLLAAEDEVEALQPVCGCGDDVARGEGVGVGEGPVREQDGPVRARGYALAQGFGGGVGTHRDAGYLPAAALLYLDGGFQGVGVQGVQYGRDASADEAAP